MPPGSKAYALFRERSAFLAVLDLPPGHVAVVDGHRLAAIHDASGTVVFAGPFPDPALP